MPNRNEELQSAAKRGNAGQVALWIRLGADINSRSSDGSSPLLLAAWQGHLDATRKLISAGAELDLADESGFTGLSLAASNGHIDVVNALIKAGANIEQATNKGNTPLMLAATNGHEDVVDTLLKAGARCEAVNNTRETALIWAAINGHANTVKRLLSECNRDVIEAADNDGDTALTCAARQGQFDAASVLIDGGANVNAAENSGKTALMCAGVQGYQEIVSLLITHGALVDMKDKEGDTALMLAANNGQNDSVTVLLDGGASIEETDDAGFTALGLASYRGKLKVVKTLLARGANVHAVTLKGNSALVLAAIDGHMDVITALVNAGADLDSADKNGDSGLHWAAMNGYIDVITGLLRAGARIDTPDNDGDTPLLCAAMKGKEDAVRVLLQEGANPNIRNKKGMNALDLANFKEHAQVVSVLQAFSGSSLELLRDIKLGNMESVRLAVDRRKADVRGAGGCTPLMVAVQHDQLDIVKLLLFRGSNASSVIAERDDSGRTALHYAAQLRNMAVLRLLLAQGANPRLMDEHGVTPIGLAAVHGHVDVVRELYQHDQRSGASQVLTGIDLLQSSSVLHLAVGSTCAAIGAIKTVVQYLLSVMDGANVDVVDANGWTALHHAARRLDGASLVKLLLDNGAEINSQIEPGSRTTREEECDLEGDTPLHLAVRHGNLDSFRVLVSQLNVQLELRNKAGETPFLTAISAGNPEIAIVLLEAGANPDAQQENGESALLLASRGQSDELVNTLLQHGARVDAASKSGDTALDVARSEEIRSVLQLYQSSQRFHDHSLELLTLASSGESPTFDQLMDLVPLVTSVYDLRLLLTLASTLDLLKQPDNSPGMVGDLLKAAFHQVLTQKLVLDDDACVFFRLVLEHCVNTKLMTPREYMKWKLQATKVNMESAAWVLELKKQVHQNSQRLGVQSQAIRIMAQGMRDMHAMVMENHEAVVAVASRVIQLREQVDLGKKVLASVVEHANQLAGRVGRFEQRLIQSESRVVAIASSLETFRSAYIKRLEQEQKVKMIKMGCGLLASVVGFAFAPLLKDVFDAVIDLSNPIEIYNHAYSEHDIVSFLADRTTKHVLEPVVQAQLESLAIPSDEFETVLRQEIVMKHPELVVECEQRGLAVVSLESGYADDVRALVPTLDTEELALVATIKELEETAMQLNSTDASSFVTSDKPKPHMVLVPNYQSDEAAGVTVEAFDRAKHEPATRAAMSVTAQPVDKSANQGDMHLQGGGLEGAPVIDLSSSEEHESVVPNRGVSCFLADGEKIVFVDDLDQFPFHFAVHSSNGDLNSFLELTDVINDEEDDPNAVMKLRLVRQTVSKTAICAAEYAYLLGYAEIGDFLAQKATDKGSSARLKTAKAASVTLLESADDFPFVFAVQESRGDVEECELLVEVIDQHEDAVDETIRAEVVREGTISEETWSAVELACHLGYVDIVKHLLVKKRVKTVAKSVVVLQRARQRAKTLSAPSAA